MSHVLGGGALHGHASARAPLTVAWLSRCSCRVNPHEQLTSMHRRLQIRGGAADVFHQASTVLQGKRARVACVHRRCCCVVLALSLGGADSFFSFLFFFPPLGSASGSPLGSASGSTGALWLPTRLGLWLHRRRAPVRDVLRVYDAMCQHPSATFPAFVLDSFQGVNGFIFYNFFLLLAPIHFLSFVRKN